MRPALWRTLLAVGVVLVALGNEWFLAAVYGEDEVTCGVGAFPVQLPHVPEASGLAPSRRHPDVFWTFNDSNDPSIYGVDTNGDLRSHVRITGLPTGNWEDISTGPCGSGFCLYVGDIGDNEGNRPTIRIARFTEPRLRDHLVDRPEAFEGRYPDGPHDAEGAFVLPNGQLFVVTKDKFAVVYRFPLEHGQVTTLERAAVLPLNNVTDADASADGERVAVRTKENVIFYRTSELLKGDVEHGTAIRTGDLGEPQGEGVAFGADGLVALAGEGGGKKHAPKPGTLATLQCEFKDAPGHP
jgi:hypothetical protein